MALFGNLFSSDKKESLDKGLEKSKESFFGKLGKALVGKSTVDDEVLDNLEEILVSSDVGVTTTLKIIERIQQRVARDKYLGTSELDRILKEEVAGLRDLRLVAHEVPAAREDALHLRPVDLGVGEDAAIDRAGTGVDQRAIVHRHGGLHGSPLFRCWRTILRGALWEG